MVFFLHVCEKIPVPDVFLFSFFFFVSNITTIWKNKIPPFSESEMISEELESSHLSSFGVNLTNIFKIIAKYSRKIISKYLQKSLFIASLFIDFLMSDQIFLSFKFSYVAQGVHKLRGLFLSPFYLHGKVNRRTIQINDGYV